ncbi:hypothetical protein QTP88_010342 [Uroleucon formosanum]
MKKKLKLFYQRERKIKSIDTDNVDDTVDTVPSPSNILYPKEDEAEAVVLEISTNNNLNDTQNDEYLLSGRRIVYIAYFFKSIQRIKHKGFECSFSKNMTLVNEKRNGFSSNFVFKCLICGVFENIYSENPDRKDVDINMAITSAVINTGQGYSQLDEFTAVLDMSCYANSSYQKYHEKFMRDIAGKRKCSSGQIVPGDPRNILRNNLQKLRCAVTKAIEYRRERAKSLSVLHKKICNKSPGDFTKRFINRKQTTKICKTNRKLTYEPSSRRVTKVSLPADKDYGNCEENICKELDMDENDYEKLKLEIMKNKIIKNSDEIKLIEKSTKLQSECELWHKERRIRLTASNFGTIYKLRPATSRAIVNVV